MAYERNCYCCDTEYKFCNRCVDFDDQPRWRMMFCSENCKDIYNTLSEFNAGFLSKETTQDLLSCADLNVNLNVGVKKVLDKVYASIKDEKISKIKTKKATLEENNKDTSIEVDITTND